MSTLSKSITLSLLWSATQAFADLVTVSIDIGTCGPAGNRELTSPYALPSPTISSDPSAASFTDIATTHSSDSTNVDTSTSGGSGLSLTSTVSLVPYPLSTSGSRTVISSPAATCDPCSNTTPGDTVPAISVAGQTYNITCGAYFDSDLVTTKSANNFQGCLPLCDDYENCIAVTYDKANTTQNCQLLSAISEIFYGAVNFDSAYRSDYKLSSNVVYSTLNGNALTMAAPTVFSVSIATSSSSPISTSSSDASSLSPPFTSSSYSTLPTTSSSVALISSTSAASLPFAPGPVSLPATSQIASAASSIVLAMSSSALYLNSSLGASGSTMSVSADSSLAASSSLSTTAAGSSFGPAASSAQPSTSGVALMSAESTSAAAASSASGVATSGGSPTDTGGSTEPTVESPEPDCGASPPVGNETRYTDYFSETYDIRCGLGINGRNADIDAHADTFIGCLEYCSLLDGCAAVSYIDGNNAFNNNSNCYPYTTFTGYSTGGPATTYSGVNVDGASPGALGSDDLCGAASDNIVNGVFPDQFATCYFIGCGAYMTYGDPYLFATDLDTLEACLTYCSLYNTCIAVDWKGPHIEGDQGQANCVPIASTGTVFSNVASSTQYAASTPCPS